MQKFLRALRKYCYRIHCLLLRAETVKDEARLWISKPVTWVWNQITKGKFYPLDGSVHICVPAFLLPQTPVTTEWAAEWDMFFRGSTAKIRACQETQNAAWDGGRNCIQADRQNTYGKDNGDVAYRNKQGTCTASSNSNQALPPVLSLGTAVPNTLFWKDW